MTTTPHGDDEGGIAVAVEHVPGAEQARVRVEGEVDTASVGELAAALERVVASGATDLRLDLGDVAFIDSTGLTALITARTLLEGRGSITVESASSAVRRTFEIAGLDVVFGTA
jgi:anti-sigma B factor antagonist